MGIGFYRTVRVKEGCAERFQRLMLGYAKAISMYEPGCTFHATSRSTTDPLEFTVHEEYADRGALEIHRTSDHKRLWLPVILREVASVSVSCFAVQEEDAVRS